jgi:hypothetical protein
VDHLALDVLGLATDPRRKVPSPSMIKPGHLGKPGGFAHGNAVREPAFEGTC